LLSIGLSIAAVILVGGWLATRWHRDRMRFALMRAALERGVTRFPGTPPYWLVSLRQGVTLAVLGCGLGVLGTGAWLMVRDVQMPLPPQFATTQPTESQPEAPEEQLPPPRPEDRDFIHPPRPGEPPLRREDRSPPPRQDRPANHPHDPAMERWHRAQAQQTIGLVSVGVGFILLLLGVVRIGFAKIEQRYVTDTDDTTTMY
jgi:hypothetical protein